VLIGVAIGFVLQLVFDAVGLAGQVLANTMGLSFAFNVDPLRGASTAAIGQFYVVLMVLTFLVLDGHLAVIQLVVDGFRTLPVGLQGLGSEGMLRLAASGSLLFSGAISIALPGLTALLVANIGFGLISRAAPTLNIFAVGFPITIVFGLVVLQLGLPGVQQGFIALLQQVLAEAGALQVPGR
jgi:flagellar biosynthetic protein FliR